LAARHGRTHSEVTPAVRRPPSADSLKGVMPDMLKICSATISELC